MFYNIHDNQSLSIIFNVFKKIHFRPDGQKYKKAREWQTGVVNAQWLTDLLCGQMNALHQTENPKYQQYSLSNPFRLDYSLVPHLMGIVNLIIFFSNKKIITYLFH